MVDGLGRSGRWWWHGCLLLVMAGMIWGAGGAGCQQTAAQPTGGTAGMFDATLVDLINMRRDAATQPTPEPQVITQGDRSTLVYTARHARTEELKDAVAGILNPDGTIQDSAALNSIIIQDKPEVITTVLAVLKSLDNPTPQLLVEARVVEVTVDDDLEYEITHTLTIPNSPGALFQNSDITLKVPGANPTPGQGAELHIRPWASADIRLDNFIRLLETRGKANILSSPNVIVAPGTEASIITGQEVPVQSSTVVSGSVSTTTVFKRVGIKLRVLLQQLTSDTARLEINPEVSTVTGSTQTAGGVSNPIISLRNVSSTLSLKDGEVLTIGGLLLDQTNLDTRGIPWLQDLPRVDFLFQSKNDKKTRTQLIFFIRVHILPEAMPGDLFLHKPGAGLEVGNDARLLNPTVETQPSLKSVTETPSGTQPAGRKP